MIDDDCQVDVSSCGRTRVSRSLSSRKKIADRRPDDRQESTCSRARLCLRVTVQGFQESSDSNVCAPSENRTRANGGSICDVPLSAQLARLIRHIVSECELNGKVKKKEAHQFVICQDNGLGRGNARLIETCSDSRALVVCWNKNAAMSAQVRSVTTIRLHAIERLF